MQEREVLPLHRSPPSPPPRDHDPELSLFPLLNPLLSFPSPLPVALCSYGVVKMNIDTDTQWAYWDGVRAYEAKNKAYLQGQVRSCQSGGDGAGS